MSLSRLVGHANMLDELMINLANAEQEQERWFNKSLSGPREEEEISHEETIMEEPEEAEDEESSDESDYEEEFKPTKDEDDMEMDDEEDESLSLTRTASRHSPPELTHDDSDSEDDFLPSPPNVVLSDFTIKSEQSLFAPTKEVQEIPNDGFYLPTSQHPTIIAAY